MSQLNGYLYGTCNGYAMEGLSDKRIALTFDCGVRNASLVTTRVRSAWPRVFVLENAAFR
jgi:hypothetical protein